MAKYSSLTNLGELIPRPDMIDDTIHEDGNTMDIIQTILMADGFKSHMAAREMKAVSSELIGENDYHTLMNVWEFVHDNIRYKADPRGHERIKSPSRLWHDREGDCKSFSLMIGSILRNYKTIGFSYRFVGYDRKLNDYTHVYVIAHMKNRPVVMDAVHTRFDEEVPYVLKKDYSMTQISHLHGISAPNYNRGARPSQAERFADAPRKAIRVPNIKDIPNLTEGQLSLILLDQSLDIDRAFYGDSIDLQEGKRLIHNALKTGSGSITGIIGTDFGLGIAAQVNEYSRKNYAALNILNLRHSSINGQAEYEYEKRKCEEKYPVPLKCVRKNIFGKCLQKAPDLSTPEYQQFLKCLNLATANYNIFNTKEYINGSHHMLYEFNTNRSLARVDTKTVLHKNAISSWADISGISRENVVLFTANGIKQTAASNGKIQDISPQGSLDLMQKAYLYKGQDPAIGEVVAILTAIVAVISICISAYKAISESIDRNKINRADLYEGIGHKEFGPEVDDWIETLEKNQNYIIGGAALLAAALFFFPKKSKS